MACKKLLKDPLIHFLLLGVLVFILFDVLNQAPEAVDLDTQSTITITQAESQALVDDFKQQYNRAPTPEELMKKVSELVETEVFYRSALRLELDKNDDQVKQRLAEKMRYLTQDISEPATPTQQELQQYLADNDFSREASVDFEQLFFSPARDISYNELLTLATDVVKQLQQGAEVNSIKTSMPLASSQYENATKSKTEEAFGDGEFTQKLFTLAQSDAWQGPFQSPFGVHLVRILKVTPALLDPTLEQVNDEVIIALLEDKQRKHNAEQFQKLKQAYQITLNLPDAYQTAAQTVKQTVNQAVNKVVK